MATLNYQTSGPAEFTIVDHLPINSGFKAGMNRFISEGLAKSFAEPERLTSYNPEPARVFNRVERRQRKRYAAAAVRLYRDKAAE